MKKGKAMKTFILVLLSLILIQYSFGQNNEIKITDDPLGWLETKGFKIAKSFDGTKNEVKPAFFQYSKDFVADTNSNMTVDIAIKYNPVRLGEFDSFFFLYPALEWHRKVVNQDLEDPNSFNKLSGSLKNELKFLKNTKPVFVSSFNITNDFKNDELEMSLITESTVFLPSQDDAVNTLYLDHKKRSIKVYPYIGMEQFWGMIETIDQLIFLKTRTHLEIKPLPGELLALNFNYSLRYQLTDHSTINSPRIISASAIFKVSKYFSITLDYDYGREPKTEFQQVNTLLLGLGIKV